MTKQIFWAGAENSKDALPSEIQEGEIGKPIENHSTVIEPSEANTLKWAVKWLFPVEW